ncbi:MAG: PAS domain S-box protein, partial [Caldimonas sp.]
MAAQTYRAYAQRSVKYVARSMLATVVRDRNGPIGVLKIVADEPSRFGAAEADSLELLAEAFGAVVQRKRAEEEAQDSIRIQAGIVRLQQDMASSTGDLQALTELLVAGAQALTAADGAAVALVEGDASIWRAVSGSAVGRLGQRVETGASAHSVMTAPVHAGNAVAGMLEVVCARSRAFGQREAGTLQILAEWLGVLMQRAEALQQLRLSESQYRLLFAANPLPMWVFDTETLRFLAVNDTAVARYGYTKDEFLSMTIKDIRPKGAAPLIDRYRDRGDPGGQIAGVWPHRIKDGSFIDVEVSSNAIRFGARAGRLVLAHDVTERKRAERQLQKTEAVLEIAGRVAHVAGWTFDLKDRVFAYSDELCALHDLPAGSAVSLKQALDFYAPESRAAMRAAVNACAVDGTPYDLELELITVRGRRIGVRTIGQPVRNPSGTIVGTQGAVQDITERRVAQEALRSLNENLETKVAERTLELELTNGALASKEEEIRSVVEHMADSVINFDDDGVIRSANPMVEAIFGYAAHEVVGRNIATLVPALGSPVGAAPDGPAGQTTREARGLHRSGAGLALEVAVSHYRIRGQRLWTAILRDIGERVAIMADLEQARSDAEQASRAKSEFVATMSHEIRTPMNGVIGMIDVLEQTELAAEQATMLGLARDSAHSLMEIIEDILDFSKIEAGKIELECQPMSIPAIVEKVCALVAGVAGAKGVELATRVDASVPEAVWGDALRVRQVLMHLVTNAIKFSSGRGVVARVAVSVAAARSTVGTAVLELAVEDNGIGIDAATIGTLFKPFSQADASTTRRFGGTGLGLVISRHLVELMGGEISVCSTPEVGSTFTVRLPFEIATGAPIEGRAAPGRA